MAQIINLNIIPKGIPDVVNVSQFDIGRTLQFNLHEGAQIYTIPAGATVVIGGKKGDANIFTYDAAISEDRHTVTVITTEQMTAIAGENLCQLRINSVDAEIATINFRMFVQERPDVGDIESVSEIPAIIELARQQQYNAEAWAKGTKNGIDVIPSDPQYNDHAKYWAEQAEAAAESFVGGVKYKGAIAFANIPITGQENGWMYNVTDSFTTDARFAEGAGKYCEAGTNIVWDGTASLWDVAGGLGGVNSFNGRHGNITPAANDYDASQIKYGTNSNVNAELNNKTNLSVIAEEFDSTASYAVGDYVMYNGVLYKCTTAHTGVWVDADFTATLVSDEFGSGGGTADITVIAAEFSSSTAYAVGDYVTYEGKFYKCTTAHSAGAWNAAHFTETTVDNEYMAKGRDYVTAGKAANSSLGQKATAEGSGVTASGQYSHAEGDRNASTNKSAHAEGQENTAGGSASHAEGYLNTISSGGLGGHAEGYKNTVSAYYAHAEGENNTVSHRGSHAEGQYNQTGATYQHVGGKYNVGKSTTLFEIGNGTANNARANAFEIEADGDVVAAGEITDGGNNVLSDKYDATSLTFPNERFTISASGWSSTQTSGYYTYTLSTGDTKYNTYCPVFMDKTGVNDSTDPTSAEEAAYALVNKFDMASGTGVNSFTLYAKTKPTTTFYIKLSGQYMAKNAASSTKALDITTGCSLTLVDNNRSLPFNGSTNRTLAFRYYVKEIKTTDWSSVVNASGYYSCFISLNADMCPFAMRPSVSIYGLPTAAEAAAYALVDYFSVADSSAISSVYAYAKTKPTSDFTITITGVYFA